MEENQREPAAAIKPDTRKKGFMLWLIRDETHKFYMLTRKAVCDTILLEPLAQSVEQLPFKQWVVGSSPTRLI